MKKGFTLIELLVVITILAIMATIILSILQVSSLKRSRDTRRMSDLKQYQLALENYATNNSASFPVSAQPVRAAGSVCTNLAGYLEKCTEDPWYSKDGSPSDCTTLKHTYCYSSDGIKWVLWTKVEVNTTDASKRYWVLCSDRQTGYITNLTLQASGTCPL